MLINIYKEKNGSIVLADTNSCNVKSDYSDICSYLEKRCRDVFGGNVVSFPNLVLYSNPEGKSTFRIKKGSSMGYEGRNTGVLSPDAAAEEYSKMSDIVYMKDGVKTTEKFGAEFLYEGFVISTGVTMSNIFGLAYEPYLVGIRKKARSGVKSCAKMFPTASSALRYVEKHEDAFRYLSENSGWKPKVMFVSDWYERFFVSSFSRRKIDNARKALDVANKFLEDCASETVPFTRASGQTAKEEALFRMRDMRMMNTVMRKFISGTVMMSEFGGILYDLDEGAAEALRAAERKGLLPYHVVKTQTKIGTMYAVLYVSPETEDWKFERYDPAEGTTMAFVKNGEIEEFGTVVVRPCNGGVARIA